MHGSHPRGGPGRPAGRTRQAGARRRREDAGGQSGPPAQVGRPMHRECWRNYITVNDPGRGFESRPSQDGSSVGQSGNVPSLLVPMLRFFIFCGCFANAGGTTSILAVAGSNPARRKTVAQWTEHKTRSAHLRRRTIAPHNASRDECSAELQPLKFNVPHEPLVPRAAFSSLVASAARRMRRPRTPRRFIRIRSPFD